MMQSLYFKKLNQRYEKLEQKKKNILLIVLFFVLLIFMSEYLLFNSVDLFNKASLSRQELMDEKNKLLKQKQDLYLTNAQKSQNNLVKQKNDLNKEIDALLNNNKNISYVSSQKLPEVLGKLIEQIGSLVILDFKNKPLEKSTQQEVSSILVKHFFVLQVSGNYQSIYELLNKFKEANIVHVSSINIEKQPNNLNATIEFYIINTNKNVINF